MMALDTQPTLAQLQQLPLTFQTIVGPEHLDEMGHMNVRYYVGFFDEGTWGLFKQFGMDVAYFEANNAGAFALRQFINYLAEVRATETVSVRSRLLGRSTKRLHFMHFMVNETTGRLAATLEALGSHADLSQRRTSPLPPAIARRVDEQLALFTALDWPAPICGVMGP